MNGLSDPPFFVQQLLIMLVGSWFAVCAHQLARLHARAESDAPDEPKCGLPAPGAALSGIGAYRCTLPCEHLGVHEDRRFKTPVTWYGSVRFDAGVPL